MQKFLEAKANKATDAKLQALKNARVILGTGSSNLEALWSADEAHTIHRCHAQTKVQRHIAVSAL